MIRFECKECGGTYNIAAPDEAPVGTRDAFVCEKGTHPLVRYEYGWKVGMIEATQPLPEVGTTVVAPPKAKRKKS